VTTVRRSSCAAAIVLILVTGCSSQPAYEDVSDLFEAAGGAAWCGTELNVTLAPFVGNCGDPSGDGRVVLAISYGGDEIRISVDRARGNLVEDGQLLLVSEDPHREVGFQLRGRDRSTLEEAQAQLGGVLLDSEGAIDDWLGTPIDERPETETDDAAATSAD